MAEEPLYIGLISGTSMDGIDAALVGIGHRRCTILATLAQPFDSALRQQLIDTSQAPEACNVDRLGSLDRRIGEAFRDAALALIRDSGTHRDDIVAIGSHGQTIRHCPAASWPFTLQLGDPNVISAGTGITTVADFRRRDVALGGQGAPLAPAFHHWLWGSAETGSAVLNIGGFANLTILPPGERAVVGFDTGPGNALMDRWCERHQHRPFDDEGAWGAGGTVSEALLSLMLDDDYFRRPPPKSTGFEYFSAAWLDAQLARVAGLPPADVQATLCELTARSAADALLAAAPATTRLMICGGGAHNAALLSRLQARLPRCEVQSTGAFGIGPDWVEAAAFAWLAARCLAGEPGNLPSVTGAREASVLGAIYAGRA